MQKLQKEAEGIYYRETDKGERTYILRTKHRLLRDKYKDGRADEGMGNLPIEEVKAIQAALRLNLSRKTPPYTYKEYKASLVAAAQEAHARARDEQQRVLAAEKKRLNSSVAQVWENIYWPERLANTKYSQRDTDTIKARWRRLIKPFFGNIPMSELKKEHFIEFVRQTRETAVPPRFSGEKPKYSKHAAPQKLYSESVIHKCLANMRHLWSIAQEHDLVSGVFPGKSLVNQVKENEKKVCYLEIKEVKKLLDKVAELRFKDRTHHDVFCYVTIALFLGLRAGDIHKLTQQSIERCIIEETKNNKGRFVNFNLKPVSIMLEERLGLYPVQDEQSFLFTTKTGRPYDAVPRRYAKIIKELGFNDIPRRKDNARERIDFHALRHTYATQLMVSGGVTTENLQKLGGWKSPRMVMHYVEIAEHIQARESKKIINAYKLLKASKTKAIPVKTD